MSKNPGAACAPAQEWQTEISIVQCLRVFKRLLQQARLKTAIKEAGLSFYDRLFTPAVTLGCMLFQRLNHDHTLQAAVSDLHSGGADLLAGKKGTPPSKRIRSLSTAAFSKARARIPLTFFPAVGSTVVSEQALALRQLLKDMAGCLYLGDRNFGVFQMVQGVLRANAHCLFRMSETRAGKVAGRPGLLHSPGDYAVSWSPSRDDLRHEGCRREAIGGRLIVAQYTRPGFRTQWIYLFTTLSDASAHPAHDLVELYGTRWQVELNIRFLKTQMGLHQLECKTRDMAEKEWLCGLMAYNLVRVVMAAAATARGLQPSRMSFSAARRCLVRWLLGASSWAKLHRLWRKALKSVARARLPTRKKPRPPEPRAKRHKRETFPPLRGSRSDAREAIRTNNMKS